MALGASGRVSRIFPHEELTYISLEGLDPGVTPKDGYFLLRKNHPNYNALYSLTLVAAVNRYVLHIRTWAEITNQEYGEVAYMVVDW
ncbi:MAG TPA: hypothetical protein VLK82_10205 [Candidatus Tectomicrobia bacterium]|nr:hypothetical protein [Candidatus Tectomicrobia bacterium]